MRILDLYCGAGGAAMGLHRSFPHSEIVGVDIAAQPRYPFTFVQSDALTYLLHYGRTFDFIWASPPCQHYTAGRRAQRLEGDNPHPDLIAPTRHGLMVAQRPYIMENVEGAPLVNPIRLCGQMFGLRVLRHRLFEANFSMEAPAHNRHTGSMLDGSIVAVYGAKWLVSGGARKGESTYHTYGVIPREFRTVDARRDAMGIDWMNGRELNEAIPPAYSEYLAQYVPSVDALEAAA